MTEKVTQNINIYRPEIDFLRALAILAVCIFHLDIKINGNNILPGGFFGVDIFFVISGYLISKILLKDLLNTSNINFKYFFERRARRILPILLFVVTSSLLFSIVFIDLIQLYDVSLSGLSSLFFSSNFYFYIKNVEYAAQESIKQPLLHTWSLGVEEQFYIIFPIFLYLAWNKSFKKLVIIFSLIFFISFFYAASSSVKNYELNFFMLHSRIWELGLGFILAYIELKKIKPAIESRYRIFFIIFAIFLFFISFLFVTKNISHPGYHTLIPVIGSVIFIFFGNAIPKHKYLKHLISKPILFVGLISYSLYLWHFPVLSFSNILLEDPSDIRIKLSLILFIFTISSFSFFLIEKPFRDRNLIKFSSFIKFIITGFVIFFILFIFSILKFNKQMNIITNKFNVLIDQRPWEVLKDDVGTCWDQSHCYFESHLPNHQNILFVGDSVLHTSASSFVNLYKKFYSIKLMNFDACYLLPKEFYGFRNDKPFYIDGKLQCSESVHNIRDEYIDKVKPIVVIGGMLDVYLDYYQNYSTFIDGSVKSRSVEDGVKEKIQSLLDKGIKVVVLLPGPRAPISSKTFVIDQLRNSIKNKSDLNLIQKIDIHVYKDTIKRSHSILNSIIHDNYLTVSVDDLFCDNEFCYFNSNDELYIYDDVHPSLFMGDKIAEKIHNAIQKKWFNLISND